jgi:hypothetical protein
VRISGAIVTNGDARVSLIVLFSSRNECNINIFTQRFFFDLPDLFEQHFQFLCRKKACAEKHLVELGVGPLITADNK